MPLGSEFPRWPIETVAVLVSFPTELPLSSRALEIINATKSQYFGDVVRLNEADILHIADADKETIQELSDFLGCFDLSFGMEIPGWSAVRANEVRKILDARLPEDVAINALIKKSYANEISAQRLSKVVGEDSIVTNFNRGKPVEPPQKVPELARDVAIPVHSAEQNFTNWSIGIIALLVARPKELPLSVRATNALFNHAFFGEVISLSEADLLRAQNLGKKTASEISEFVASFGLRLGMTIPGWSSERASEARDEILARLPKSVALTNLIDPNSVDKGSFGNFVASIRRPIEDFMSWPAEKIAMLVAHPSELFLSVRTTNALSAGGFSYLGEVVQLPKAKLLRIRNLGRKSVEELKYLFGKSGFECGSEVPGWTNLRAEECRKTLGEAHKKLVALDLRDTANVYRAAADSLESELKSLIAAVASSRNTEIVVNLWGINGSPPKVLEAVGKEIGVTRERIRQISDGVKRRIDKLIYGTPFLDRALDLVCKLAPGSGTYLADQLKQAGISKVSFDIDSLILASKLFKRETDLHRVGIDGAILFVNGPVFEQFSKAIYLIRKHAQSNGFTSVNRLASELNLSGEDTAGLRQMLTFIPEIIWLDDGNEWLSSTRIARNRLINLIAKVLYVAPTIRASELRGAVARSRRLAHAPPVAILKRFCQLFKLAEVDGEFIKGGEQRTETQLSGIEKVLVEAFVKNGLVLSREELENFCIEARGVNPTSFYIYLSFSPLITRLAQGIYCLVGSAVDPGEIERIKDAQHNDKKTSEYGWTGDGKLWFACELSRIAIHSGGIRLPQFVASVVGGEWVLRDDNEIIGTLKITSNFITGLRRPLIECGAEPGDVCLLTFDIPEKRAEIQIGGRDLIDRVTTGELRADLMVD
jgi:DNA-directed RNA polymerase alpha subunit